MRETLGGEERSEEFESGHNLSSSSYVSSRAAGGMMGGDEQIRTLIFAGVAVAVSVLCMVSSTFKTKEKKEEVIEEENEEGSEVRLEQAEETTMEMSVESDRGVKIDTLSTEGNNKTSKDDISGMRVIGLDCSATFKNLTSTERLYAHYTARAYFEGALLILIQSSPDTAAIFVILYRIFRFDSVAELKHKASDIGFSEQEWRNFLFWAASKLTVRSLHFIPQLSDVRLRKLVASSTAARAFPGLTRMYDRVQKTIYSLRPIIRFPDPGERTNVVTKMEYDICNRFLEEKDLITANCRFYKRCVVGGEKILTIKVASTKLERTEETYEGVKIILEKGNFADVLKSVCTQLRKAQDYAATESQREMLKKFIDHFATGGVLEYMIAATFFVNDSESTVQSRFVFRENNRNTPENRSDFNGFVATVNKDASSKYSRMIENASEILTKLPWGSDYENEKFKKPDFAAYDMIAYGLLGGITKGLHFQKPLTMGHNQVYSNIINAIPVTLQSIKTEDKEFLYKYDKSAQQVHTGLHELLGHGSGKIFMKKSNGKFNFDKKKVKDLLTGEEVTSWYEPDQSYLSVFGDLARPFEECRAFAVALVLCCDEKILGMLGHEGGQGQSVKYTIWLREMRDGLRGLSHYSILAKNWGTNAHDWARFVLMKVVLGAGEGCLSIEQTVDSKGNADLVVNLDKAKIDSVGMPAVRKFLKKLQGYKSTADVKGATALFNKYSVDARDLMWSRICFDQSIRSGDDLVFVQPNTVLTGEGGVDLMTYDETPEGVIQSVVERYSMESVANLEELWKNEKN